MHRFAAKEPRDRRQKHPGDHNHRPEYCFLYYFNTGSSGLSQGLLVCQPPDK